MESRRQKTKGQKAKGLGNQGVSFVEVIVSMLIMAIAVIPLLGSFMMSLRVNMKSRQAMSATIVAQNVMECVKEYANDKVVTANVGNGIKNYLPDAYQTSFASSGAGFILDNVREGVNDYYVEVTYDKSVFSTGINAREIPDLTTLDADSTYVVCPSGVIDGRLENEARTFFYEDWLSGQWASNMDKEDYRGPSDSDKAMAEADIKSNMTSELVIEVSGAAENAKVSANLFYYYDGKTYRGYSVERSETAGKLENVYVFYDPLRVAGDSSGDYQIEDMVYIKNPNNFSWNLFFAVQENDVCTGKNDIVKLSGPVFAMESTYMGEKINLYSSTSLSPNDLVSVDASGNKIINFESLENKNSVIKRATDARMQRVTVKVYRAKEGELLATMETDIMQ